VAMTRARDLLVLSGAVSEKRFNELWKQDHEPSADALLSAKSYCDWLGLWFSQDPGWRGNDASTGQNDFLRWVIHPETRLLEAGEAIATTPADETATAEPEVWRTLEQRLAWKYPFLPSTRKPAKTSVSALRLAAREADEEAAPLFEDHSPQSTVHRPQSKIQSPRSAADIGTAHHSFLQLVSLDDVGSVEALRAEAQRLEREEALSADEIALLDFQGLAALWESELGRNIRTQAASVRRELAFTARFSPTELAALTGEALGQALQDEFVVVQGVADLAVLLDKEIWLVDFKTDTVAPHELAERAQLYYPQLRLYARALSQIYRRPVSACWLYFLALRRAVPVTIQP